MGGPGCSARPRSPAGSCSRPVSPSARRRVRRLVHVRDRDRHARRGAPAPGVRRLHRHRVSRLLLVVQLRGRPYLPAARVDGERRCVRPFEGVGQRVPSGSVRPRPGCRSGRPPPPCSLPRLNVRAPPENMGSCWPRRVRRPGARPRPVAVALGVPRPNLHLVARAGVSPVMIMLLSTPSWDTLAQGSSGTARRSR